MLKHPGTLRCLILLSALWPSTILAAPPPCVGTVWMLEKVEDLSGAISDDQSWRMAIIYRPVFDLVTKRWTSEPVEARAGEWLCPGDRLETWHDARAIVLLPSTGYSPVASIIGEGGSVLEFGSSVVQRRGTASYLFPEGGPELTVQVAVFSDLLLKVFDAHSTFQMSVGDGCAPEVDVSVSRCDPWDDLSDPRCEAGEGSPHRVQLQLVRATGAHVGAPQTLEGGQVGGVASGERRARRFDEDEERAKEARERLATSASAPHAELAARAQPPAPDEWPVLSRDFVLRYEGARRPDRVEVDGQAWRTGAWWRARDERGARVWEASRRLTLGMGSHRVVIWDGQEVSRWEDVARPPTEPEDALKVIAVKAARKAVVPPVPARDEPAPATPTPAPVPVEPAVASVVEGQREHPAVPAELASPVGAVGAPAIGAKTGRSRTTTLGDGTTMGFVELSAGEFDMGSAEGEGFSAERPLHRVRLSQPFWMAESEVTQAQWAAVVTAAQAAGDVDAKSLKPDPSGFKGPTLPVESVSWCAAARFANALSSLENLEPAYTVGEDCESGGAVAWNKHATGYRLPTEAEWEYAARAGTTTDYSFGDDPKQRCTYANVFDESGKKGHPDFTWEAADCDDGNVNTAPVCSFERNPWGLCDLHGNVWEWTWDWYAADTYAKSPQTDPTGAASADSRVIRGGSWFSFPVGARSAYRVRSRPGNRNRDLGFRLVLPVSPPALDLDLEP